MLMARTMSQGPESCSAPVDDRRLNQRYDGAGLQVEIEGRVHPVVNVSMGGFCLVGLNRKVGERFRFVMSRLGATEGVASEAQVLAIDGGRFHLVFTRPTMPLLRVIVAHVSALTGVSPHLLKNR